jgi:hypothetical protein
MSSTEYVWVVWDAWSPAAVFDSAKEATKYASACGLRVCGRPLQRARRITMPMKT